MEIRSTDICEKTTVAIKISFIERNDKVLQCLGEKCYYYYKSDNFEMCDLVIDSVIIDDNCIGYEQIQKEMEETMRDMAYASRKYEKLQRLQARIKAE